MLKGTMKEVAAEFLGTFVLIVFGLGVVAQVVLSGKENGEYFSINVAWGLAVTMGIYVAGGITGAHLNPAVTIALAVHKKFAWNKVVPYVIVQVAAAFVASALIYVTYYQALNDFDGGVRTVPAMRMNAESSLDDEANSKDTATAGIWATYPQDFLSPFPAGLIDQIVGTGMLVLCVFALSDEKNLAPKSNLAPLLVGALVFLIGMTFGYNCGYAINPARDFGPRLFTAVAGWGMDVFRAGDNFWWVPIVGPIVGGILGGAVYEWLIAKHHEDDLEQ